MGSYGQYDDFFTSGVPVGSRRLQSLYLTKNTNNYCFIWVPIANIMTYLHEGFLWVPVDFKVDLFYAHTYSYCFV